MGKYDLLILGLLLIVPLSGCADYSDHSGEYNLSLVSNQSGIVGMIEKTNEELMFGHFGNLLLISATIILYMGFFSKTVDSTVSLSAAMFIGFLGSMMLRVINLVPDITVFVYLMGTAMAAAFLYLSNR